MIYENLLTLQCEAGDDLQISCWQERARASRERCMRLAMAGCEEPNFAADDDSVKRKAKGVDFLGVP